MHKETYEIAKHFKFNIFAKVKHHIASGFLPRAVYGGIDFYEYKEYHLGDDIRFIDWNLLARLDKKIVRTFCSDYTGSVDIIMDISASMKLGEPPKSYASEKIALLLAGIAKNSNFTISIYTFSNSNIKIYRNYDEFRMMLLNGAIRYTGSTYLNDMITSYLAIKKSKSPMTIHLADIAFFISDFHSQDDMNTFFKTIPKAGKLIVLLNIYSLAEIENIKLGKVMFEEPETGVRKQVFVSGWAKKTFIDKYSKFLEFIKQNAIKNGLMVIQMDSKMSLYSVVSNLLRSKIIKREK